jgi:hypothetical protein
MARAVARPGPGSGYPQLRANHPQLRATGGQLRAPWRAQKKKKK